MVLCYDCPVDPFNKVRVWRWLCEVCAEECVEAHRRETGHKDMRINISEAATMEELLGDIKRVARITGGW